MDPAMKDASSTVPGSHLHIFFDSEFHHPLDQIYGQRFIHWKLHGSFGVLVLRQFTLELRDCTRLWIKSNVVGMCCKPDQDAVEKEGRHLVAYFFLRFGSYLFYETPELSEFLLNILGKFQDVFVNRNGTRRPVHSVLLGRG